MESSALHAEEQAHASHLKGLTFTREPAHDPVTGIRASRGRLTEADQKDRPIETDAWAFGARGRGQSASVAPASITDTPTPSGTERRVAAVDRARTARKVIGRLVVAAIRTAARGVGGVGNA